LATAGRPPRHRMFVHATAGIYRHTFSHRRRAPERILRQSHHGTSNANNTCHCTKRGEVQTAFKRVPKYSPSPSQGYGVVGQGFCGARDALCGLLASERHVRTRLLAVSVLRVVLLNYNLYFHACLDLRTCFGCRCFFISGLLAFVANYGSLYMALE